MATEANHLIELLENKGLRLVRKFNICGYFEYHVVNQADQTIAKILWLTKQLTERLIRSKLKRNIN